MHHCHCNCALLCTASSQVLDDLHTCFDHLHCCIFLSVNYHVYQTRPSQLYRHQVLSVTIISCTLPVQLLQTLVSEHKLYHIRINGSFRSRWAVKGVGIVDLLLKIRVCQLTLTVTIKSKIKNKRLLRQRKPTNKPPLWFVSPIPLKLNCSIEMQLKQSDQRCQCQSISSVNKILLTSQHYFTKNKFDAINLLSQTATLYTAF